MPLNRFRNYQALMSLVPGTTPMAFGNAETDTPARSLATNVNGQVNTNNTTRTDGATNMNIWLPNHNMYISPAETVDTVNVVDEQLRRRAGQRRRRRGHRRHQVRHQPVPRVGVRVLQQRQAERDAEVLRRRERARTSCRSPPTPTAGRSAARSRRTRCSSSDRSRDSGAIRACSRSSPCRTRGCARATSARRSTRTARSSRFTIPTTGVGNGFNRTQFPNNQIPANRLSPIALRVLNLFPLPNSPGTGAGGFMNNYRRQEDRTFARDNWDAKVNWNRTSSHQIWGKFSYMNATVDDLTNYLGPDPERVGRRRLHEGLSGHRRQTWTLAPTLLMDMTFGFGRQDQHVLGPDFQAGNFGLDVLGIPGHERSGHLRLPAAVRRLSAVQLHHVQRGRQPGRVEPDLPRRAHLLARRRT